MGINKVDRVVLSNDVQKTLDEKADKTYTDGQLNLKANKVDVYTKGETDKKIKDIIGTAPDVLDTLGEIADALNDDKNFASTMTVELSKKVDKITGKGLSTEDYTTAEKTKLSTIQSNAQVNLTAQEMLNQLKTVDGIGSGLDANLFDGKTSGYYLDYNNFTNRPDIYTKTQTNSLISAIHNFSTVKSNGQTDIVSKGNNDSLTINVGEGLKTVTDPSTNTITISSNVGAGGFYIEKGLTKTEEFTATELQTVFTLTQGEYVVGNNKIAMYIYGIRQPNSCFTEIDSKSIRLINGLPSGTKVLLEYELKGNTQGLLTADLVKEETNKHFMNDSQITKLSNIQANAEVNQNAFSNVKVGTSVVSADSKTDTLELVSGNNISLVTDEANDKIVINNTYNHPANHPANMIVEDSTHRFTNDSDKATLTDVDSKKHTHNNLSLLETITQAIVDKWNSAYNHISDAIRHITSDERSLWNTVSNKVDKITGKSLSTNDFDNNYKMKLDGISTSANKVEASTTNGNIKVDGIEKVVYTHPSGTNPHSTTKSDLGLENVDNIQQASKTEFNTHNSDSTRHITGTERNTWNSVTNKVDKITGKGLSTNDFDNNYKTKIDGVSTNANKVDNSSINGNIKIDGVEQVIYTHPSTHSSDMITGLSKVATSGNYNDLSNKPTSLPANGGNADTVDGIHANSLQYKDGTNNYQMGITGTNTNNVWYNVFTWTVSSQYNNFQTDIKLNKRGCINQNAMLHIRGEYGSSSWSSYECYITGYELSSEDTFLLCLNNANKTVTLYYKCNNDWTTTYGTILSQILQGAIFTYNNTSTNSTTQPTGDNYLIIDSNTRYFPYWHKGNFDPSSKANATHTHPKSQITDMPTNLSQFSKDINFDERYYTEGEINNILGNASLATVDKTIKGAINEVKATVTSGGAVDNANKLNGKTSDYYLDYNNFNNKPSHTNLLSRGNITAETGNALPVISGMSMSQAYNNGYPTSFGNVITLSGNGHSELLLGWSGTSGTCADNYIRSKRDVSDSNWSNWAKIWTDVNLTKLSQLSNDTGYITTSAIPSSLPANGGNADTVDGKHAGDFANASHTHDDRYYTEGEIDSKLNTKANKDYVDTELGKKQNTIGYTPLNKNGDTMNGTLQFDIVRNASSKGILWCGLTDSHSMFVEEYGNAESTRLIIQNEDNGDSDYTVFRNNAGGVKTDIFEIHNTYIKSNPVINSIQGYQWNGQSLDSRYLGANAKAVDSNKLNGQTADYYLNYNNFYNKPSSLPANGGNADTLDGLHSYHFCRAYSSGCDFGGSEVAITTAEFITLLKSLGAFDIPYWVARGSWSYASNKFISDTGIGKIHLAGCTVEVIGGLNCCTIRIHTPTTSSSGVVNTEYVYVNNGDTYSPSWRKIWNDKNDGSGSGLDADLLDGKHANEFANASHTHDDRYYTEGEVDSKLSTKANNHDHPYIPTSATCNKNWNWSGQGGQPAWLWGGNDPTNMYVYNPSNFNVNYAKSSGNTDTVDGKHASDFANASHTHTKSQITDMLKITSSTTQPTSNNVGDVWFNIL